MEWEALLSEFRALGGVADNIRLGEGPFGRGLFPIDPSRPVKIHASENLLIPSDDLEIHDGRLAIKSGSCVGAREREFFLNAEVRFGWDAGLRDEYWKAQLAWSRLPPEVVTAIGGMGLLEVVPYRFTAPSDQTCLNNFIRTRHFIYRGTSHLAPVVDFTNHSSSGAPFVIEDGIGVAGLFAGEVLVRYNLGDSWGHAMNWGFSDRAVFAHSIAITVDAHGKRITIARDLSATDTIDGIRYPHVVRGENAISISHLSLGFTPAPDLPRAVFRKITSPDFTSPQADVVFDGIAQFNKLKFLSLLRTLRRDESPFSRILEEAATTQLETLTYCVGARSL